MAPKPLSYNATLVKRTDFTPELTTFQIKYDEPMTGTPPFVPGQYVALGLNNEAKPELGAVRRSMSIASAPEQEEWEFYIRWVKHPESDNPLTHLLWPMKAGDRLFATRKPVGKFTVRDTVGDDDPRIRLFVSAGTGLAPFVSMVRSMALQDPKADMSKIVLMHGASYPADLGYREELNRYQRENGLHYFSTVSRPNEAPDWDGDTGRVEDYTKPERLADLERRIGVEPGHLSPKTAGVLICGLQGTIARCIERLAQRGFVPFDRKIRKGLELDDSTPSHMWWEQYDTNPVVDVGDPELMASLRRDLAEAGSC